VVRGGTAGRHPAGRGAQAAARRTWVTIEWSPRAITTASRFLSDKPGLTAVVEAVDALAADPYPPESFRWGDTRRLRAGPYRVMYVIEGGRITIDRVDRITA
jgi:mRNA-degrading endonuclease RelE of RelBE toxin-antitoxin system